MKKLIVKQPWKSYLKKRSESELRRQGRKRHVNRSGKKTGKPDDLTLKPIHKGKFKSHVAPQNFSLIHNAEEVIKYFEEARDLFRKRRQIRFSLEDIQQLTPDAIAYFVAFIKEPRFTRNLAYRGNAPKNSKFSKMFDDSGFYDHVKSSSPKEKSANNVLLHKITKNKVENEVAKDLCKKAVKHSFLSERIFPPIYEVLIECMANTNNHAHSRRRGEYNWWVFSYCDPEKRTTVFTFLDLGVGVFDSLPVQTFVRRALSRFDLLSNVELVPKLFAGEISSRTGLAERGQGMPLIFTHAKNPNIRKFYLISNDIYADLKTEQYVGLKTRFPGTLLHWELRDVELKEDVDGSQN